MAHAHKWTGLWGHLGKYGRQDVHFHQCFTPSCEAMMFGAARNCVPGAPHDENVALVPFPEPAPSYRI